MESVKNIHFTEAEKDAIINISIKYRNIIENKRTDGISNKQKNIAWENIAKEYNALGINVIRTSKQLRTFYDNLKKKLKRRCADEKVELYKTGGGTMKVPPIVPAEEKLLDSLKETFHPMPNAYDSSSSYFEEQQTYEVSNENLYSVITDHDYIPDTMAIAGSSKDIGQSPKAYTGTPSRKRTLGDVYEEVSSFSTTKRKNMTTKEDYTRKCSDEKLQILSLEKEIKQNQKKKRIRKTRIRDANS
ncbi:hypothetical protein MML48_3g00005953 [Holotrichia oblita]|uniref:Uncharacterized protein n=1 Tax=Holotrichia oblita TaxID=644536 RepID=A0ACB9TH72_HOLOL|nr:hypothetical protein MML48_3g00005953 [Holotrichia oblita]